MNKKGFSLIELLAVIVILSAVVLIIAPIINGVITDSRESANKVAATNYIKAIDTTIGTETLNYISVNDGYYKISQDGNICLEKIQNGKCSGEKLKITTKGNKPIKGNVTIEKREVTRATIIYDEFTVEVGYDGEIEYFPVAKKYELGDEVVFNPGDGARTWNVIGEDTETVTLMLNENLGDTIQWYSSALNSYGPVTALNYLNTLTTSWENVDPIDNFAYINNKDGNEYANGYQKLQITRGKTIITYKDGGQNQLEGVTKARLLSSEEIIEISQILNSNLREDNLIAYLERNLESINSLLSSQGLNTVSTVDELIDFIVVSDPLYGTGPRIYPIIDIVLTAFTNGIETDYDIYPAQFLFQNLSEYGGYWLLTSRPGVETSVIYITSQGTISSNYARSNLYGIRPVITIQKSKLD